jgi:hypothetical protein
MELVVVVMTAPTISLNQYIKAGLYYKRAIGMKIVFLNGGIKQIISARFSLVIQIQKRGAQLIGLTLFYSNIQMNSNIDLGLHR